MHISFSSVHTLAFSSDNVLTLRRGIRVPNNVEVPDDSPVAHLPLAHDFPPPKVEAIHKGLSSLQYQLDCLSC